jgi:caffeoyl-CoA O-methyltransferase
MADDDSRRGTVYHDPRVLDYVQKVHADHDAPLNRAFSAPERLGLPRIQVSPSDGRLLQVLLRLVGAAKAVEIGSLAGYSAIWIARALAGDGHLWTVESEPAHASATRRSLSEAGLDGRVTVVEGRALDALPSLEAYGPFDAVFIDADKGHYDRYGSWAAAHVRPGGLLIADNAFFFGGLLDDNPEAEAVRRFHEEAREHFETACIPTPDGLLVGVRKGPGR